MIETAAPLTARLNGEQSEPSPRRRLPVYALLGGNAISLIGNQLAGLAIPWYVLTTTGSAGRTGLVAFCSLVPSIIAMVFGGALADRLGHKRMSIISDLASGATVAAIPLLHHTVGLPFPLLLLLVFLGALLDAPGAAARQALIPDATALAQMPLERVNGSFQVIQALSGLVGPPLAGLLIAVMDESNVLWIDAASFLFSAAAVVAFVPNGKRAEQSEGRYLSDVAAGFRFLRQDRFLRSLASIGTMVNFLLSPLFAVILPVLAKEAYGSASDLGIAIAGEGAGSLAGALLYTTFGHRLPRRVTAIGCFFLAALPLGLLALTPPLWVTVVSLALFGFWISPLNPLLFTIMQERVPAELRARVFGALVAASMLAAPAGVLLVGVLVAGIGVEAIVTVITCGLVVTAIIMLLNPALHDFGRPATGRTVEDVAESG